MKDGKRSISYQHQTRENARGTGISFCSSIGRCPYIECHNMHICRYQNTVFDFVFFLSQPNRAFRTKTTKEQKPRTAITCVQEIFAFWFFITYVPSSSSSKLNGVIATGPSDGIHDVSIVSNCVDMARTVVSWHLCFQYRRRWYWLLLLVVVLPPVLWRCWWFNPSVLALVLLDVVDDEDGDGVAVPPLAGRRRVELDDVNDGDGDGDGDDDEEEVEVVRVPDVPALTLLLLLLLLLRNALARNDDADRLIIMILFLFDLW